MKDNDFDPEEFIEWWKRDWRRILPRALFNALIITAFVVALAFINYRYL